jgi:GTP cyclohydrolase II
MSDSKKNNNKTEDTRLREVERALSDFRRGVPVIITNDTEALIALSTEMGLDQSIADLAQWSQNTVKMTLTSHRANVLHIKPTGEETILIQIEKWMDAALMRALADATHDLDQPFRGPFTRLRGPVSPLESVSIQLAKFGRLLPSTLTSALTLAQAREIAYDNGLLILQADQIKDYEKSCALLLRSVASANVPLQGAEKTRIHAFRPMDGGIEHLAILIGEPNRSEPVLARLHSECFTGDLLGSLKCDCGEQLNGAIKAISDAGGGVLLYLAQEGRGIGLINKLRAYNLQEQGFDTIDANERLGFDADERVFQPAAEMLKQLGINEVKLMTNNPDKINGLERCGITVAERIAHKFPSNTHNELYLATKRKRSGHYL